MGNKSYTTGSSGVGGFLYGQAKSLHEWGRTKARTSSYALEPSELSVTERALVMGETLTTACAYAMATLERSASMGVIVAAPTAGSSGVVPGVVLATYEALLAAGAPYRDAKRRMLSALWNSAAIGALISEGATVAGAEGGCQAEVGSAAAMAASALTEMLGGSVAQCLDAASIAIGNLLGLVCDPARGMVEYPCQNRNVIGVTAAVSAAQLALAGVGNPVPLDEVIAVMGHVGRSMPSTLRETALGGLATAPSVAGAPGRPLEEVDASLRAQVSGWAAGCAGCNGCA